MSFVTKYNSYFRSDLNLSKGGKAQKATLKL